MTKKELIEEVKDLRAEVKWLQFQIDKLQERQHSQPRYYYYDTGTWLNPPWTVTCTTSTNQ